MEAWPKKFSSQGRASLHHNYRKNFTRVHILIQRLFFYIHWSSSSTSSKTRPTSEATGTDRPTTDGCHTCLWARYDSSAHGVPYWHNAYRNEPTWSDPTKPQKPAPPQTTAPPVNVGVTGAKPEVVQPSATGGSGLPPFLRNRAATVQVHQYAHGAFEGAVFHGGNGSEMMACARTDPMIGHPSISLRQRLDLSADSYDATPYDHQQRTYHTPTPTAPAPGPARPTLAPTTIGAASAAAAAARATDLPAPLLDRARAPGLGRAGFNNPQCAFRSFLHYPLKSSQHLAVSTNQ